MTPPTSRTSNGSVPVAVSAEMEAFLDNAVTTQQKKERSRNDATIAPYAAEFTENDSESESSSQATDDDATSSSTSSTSSSWLSTLWLISLYIPYFLIQCIFGASFYIIRTLLLGYALNYTMQFFTVAEHCTIQWLGMNPKQNSTPLPALIGLGVLTIMALIVHPDGYTWVVLRKIRCVLWMDGTVIGVRGLGGGKIFARIWATFEFVWLC